MAALERARDQDFAVHPRQDIEYVVVDDKSSRERVALAQERGEGYDPQCYEAQIVRAVESVLSSLGWDQVDIRRELEETRVVDRNGPNNPLPPFSSCKLDTGQGGKLLIIP